jgi:hypothetical protein
MKSISSKAAVVLLLVIVLAVFGPVLMGGTQRLVSNENGDLAYQLYYWRAFGFGEMKRGNFPLWNPYIFSGSPFHSGFQAGLLYPPHWLHLVLPTAPTINIMVAFHTFLLGLFMFLWARTRQLRPLSALYSATAAMLGSHFIYHVYPGHLPNLATMSWTPALFLAVDRLLRYVSLRWILFGGIAASMQVFAGHAQYAFYTWVILSLYTFFSVIVSHSNGGLLGKGLKGGLLLLSMALMGAWVSAAQWIPGIEASRLGVRAQMSSYEFASMFSLPPENLLTYLSPFFLGDGIHQPYWGRFYIWEMCLFLGTVSFSLASAGLILSPSSMKKSVWALVLTMAASLVLALGSYLPIHRLLYEVFYPFKLLRGTSKFAFFAGLLMALLSGVGIERLLSLNGREKSLRLLHSSALVILGLAFLCGAVALSARVGTVDALRSLVQKSGQSYLPPEFYIIEKGLLPNSLKIFELSWAVAALSFVIISLFIYLAKRSRLWVHLLVFMGIVELLVFARVVVTDFPTERINKQLKLLRLIPKDNENYRVLLIDMPPDLAMISKMSNIHGFDSDIYGPYARLLRESQDHGTGQNIIFVEIKKVSSLFRILGLKYVIGKERSFKTSLEVTPLGGGMAFVRLPNALPKGYLVERWRVNAGHDNSLTELKSGGHDPFRFAVISDSSVSFPSSRPQVISLEDIKRSPVWSSALGSVWYVYEDTDTIHFLVKAERNSILLTTEMAHPGWRAWMDGMEVPLLRANYIQRAVAVPKGLHLITMKYEPEGWRWGKAISISGLAVVVILCVCVILAERGARLRGI